MIDPGALAAQITKLTVEAMKAHDAERTGTLRLIKAALMNKAVENASLTPAEEQQTLTSMIKQRRDSIEQFTKGNRPDLAEKEAAEIVVIEEFLPKELDDEAGLAALVSETLAGLEATLGHKPTVKDMGPSMKAVQARLQAGGVRADGRLVSELVKKHLAS
jgi:uncharacterized protein